jgi:hypothetical protein
VSKNREDKEKTRKGESEEIERNGKKVKPSQPELATPLKQVAGPVVMKATTRTSSSTPSGSSTTGERSFLTRWQTGRPWLKNETKKGMWCELCTKHEDKIRHLIKSRKMIDGNHNFKLETITYPEHSQCHLHATSIHLICCGEPRRSPCPASTKTAHTTDCQ